MTVVCGPAAWNHLIRLDRLPEPVPHMQFATGSSYAVGGTSAGKAVHLTALGVPLELHTLLGADEAGDRVRAALTRAGVALHAYASNDSEQHVNLMTDDGERISLYVSVPSEPDASTLDAALAALREARVAVVDLSGFGAALLPRIAALPAPPPVWTDLHDYDGRAGFHEPFLRAAEVVFMNDDAVGGELDAAWDLLASCVARGPQLAVCTRGAAGAIALDTAGKRYEVAAVPVDVVDTNGAGDGFFAGFLAAALSAGSAGGARRTGGAGEGSGRSLAELDVGRCLAAGAAQAAVALGSTAMHPLLG